MGVGARKLETVGVGSAEKAGTGWWLGAGWDIIWVWLSPQEPKQLHRTPTLDKATLGPCWGRTNVRPPEITEHG